ncbi:MAG: hypothetical protein Q9172_006961 [Xanthocarpia lactea]
MAFVAWDLYPDFEPHGLITSPFLEVDYRATGSFPPEVKTLVLLENIFNKVLFKDRNDVTVNSFRSSYYDYDKDKCHFVVHFYDKEDHAREILCFTEDVRDVDVLGKAMSVLGEFEAHVIRYCRKYLRYAIGLPEFVYVCTAFGTCLRVWKQFRHDYEFGGLWGGYGPTVDISSYLDVGNDDSSRQIQQALDQITSQSWEPGNEDTTSFYPGESTHTIALGNRPTKFPPETSPRKVDTWLRKDESGVTLISFFCQSKKIDTNQRDWKKAKSGIFSKRRLIYQNGGHYVWTEL